MTSLSGDRSEQVMVDLVVEAVEGLRSEGSDVVVVALDGRSGAGKSTLAGEIAALTGAVVIMGDDFYAGGTNGEWLAMTPAERAAHCIDWHRQRPVLETLRRGERASWHPYDWEAFDGRLSSRPITAEPATVVLLEGAYSARPELADLLDLRVLLDPPAEVRRRQLRDREGHDYRAEWESVWASAEEHYFGRIMSPDRFDVVLRPGTVTGTAGGSRQ